MSKFEEFALAHPELPYLSQDKDFATVIRNLKTWDGLKYARRGWNGVGMYVCLQVPDKDSKMGRPYLYLKAVDDTCIPWLPSQSDLLAYDWFEVVD